MRLFRVQILQTNSNESYIEKEFFKETPFRKIKKKLFYDINLNRRNFKLIFYKNVNFSKFLKTNKNLFLTITDEIIYILLEKYL